MNPSATQVLDWRVNGLSRTIAERTRRVYDRMAAVYPVSTFLFHSKAHRCALELSGIRDGMRVLEVATGSGEMFRRLVGSNRGGSTVGLDLSPRMAAHTHRRIRREFPDARSLCQAVDARYLPFRDDSFDAVVCCYLLELLGRDDIPLVLDEVRRVLRLRGVFTLVLIAENLAVFNRIYRFCGNLVPAFWGRQVERGAEQVLEASGLKVFDERRVRQGIYPSRVLAARKWE